MRLLRHDLTFVEYTDDTLPPYAILSHTWSKVEEEVSYDDILQGHAVTKGTGSQKLSFIIEQSKADGLDYFWIDTCCIDKKDAVELSRSLISMYRWYAKSTKCYVYLPDDFTNSRWLTRGWTLQELLAPTTVEFYRNGLIGTKATLEQEISNITGIPVDALGGVQYPVHDRRQWQVGRQTKEPEDLVYSMLGLLDISMPVLYGEGLDKAQRRLENEISIAQHGQREYQVAFNLAEAPLGAEHFVSRLAELDEIQQHLVDRKVILHGLGGMGKTQIALAYARRHRERHSAVFWVNAKDEDSLKSSFSRVAKQIKREHPLAITGGDLDAVVDQVIAWLSLPRNTRWLLIFDNYDNPKIPGNADPAALGLRPYFPEQGDVIITTRSGELRLGHCIQIRKVVLDDALKILEKASGRELDEAAHGLARTMDGLPLALATAGAYLSQSSITFSAYLDHFQKSWARLQQLSPALLS